MRSPRLQRILFFSIFGAGTAALVAAALFLLLPLFRAVSVDDANQPIPMTPVATGVRRALDGRLVDPGHASMRAVAIIMDNHVDARPVSGLARASLVWEVPVEGGLTRFLAVFPFDALPEKIGPVRSLRPYFLDLAGELDAALLHVGGSPEALTRAKSSPLFRLNQFFDGKYFWRDEARDAPHNVYTSGEKIAKAFADRGMTQEGALGSWQWSDVPSTAGDVAASITIPYEAAHEAVTWTWDARGVFVRVVDGTPVLDADGAPIIAENVVVQFTAIAVLDEEGRRRVTTTGSGRALLARDGRVVTGRWERTGTGRTRFFDGAGVEYVFLPGTTWVNIVPTNFSVRVNGR